ncbi:erythromycin resistance leader peptide [Siminovitchia thermophila]
MTHSIRFRFPTLNQ